MRSCGSPLATRIGHPRQLGITHTWLQKLVREFEADSDEGWRLLAAEGDPKFADLNDARECTRENEALWEVVSAAMNNYTHAVSSKKRRAQSKVVEMILPEQQAATDVA